MQAKMQWTTEHEAFIRKNAPGKHRAESYELFVEHFGVDPGLKSYIGFLKRHHIRCGIDCRFKPGHEPWSKGKPLPPETYEKCKAAMFKKGHTPHNTLPVGTELTLSDGYIWVKVRNERKPRKKQVNWIQKHRIIWEEAHGPIPEGMYVLFLNGDRSDCRLENLALASKAANSIMTKMGFRSKDLELAKSGLLVAELMAKAAERSKE